MTRTTFVEMSDRQFGLSSYAYRWSIGYGAHRPAAPMNIVSFIEKAAGFGLGRVQINDNLPYQELSAPEQRKIVSLAAKHGIAIETGVRGANTEYLKVMLDASSRLNSNLLRIVTEIDRGKSTNQIIGELDRVIVDVKNILPYAKKKGIRLAIENHATLNSKDLVYIIRSVGDPFVGVCLDTMNSILSMEPPLETVRTLAPYTLTVHLKDFRIEKLPEYFIISGVALGEGSVDFPEILRILGECGAAPTMHVELYINRKKNDMSTLAWEDECVRKSICNLRLLGAKMIR